SSSRLRLTWNSGNGTGQTLANGTKIFHICYDVVGTCANQPTSPISFINDGNFTIQFSNDEPKLVPHVVSNGSVKVNSCNTNCSVVSTKNVTCAGGSDGGITVNVPMNNTACNCVWKRADGSVFQTLPVT